MVKNIQKIIWFSVGLALLFSVSFALPAEAGNATLYLLPSTGIYETGSVFSVIVKVSSGGAPINAVEGSLIFNTSELEVIRISKSESIFTLWTNEPTFSNSAGTIEFGGGTSASFSGAAGTIITITFKALKSASANVTFLSGAVLAADGKGTNILVNMSGGTYTLKPATIIPPAKEVPPAKEIPSGEEYVPLITAGLPAAPVISSATHLDPDKWYSNNNPEFSWKVPSNATAIKLLIEKDPNALPNVLYSPSVSEKKLENLADGVWYFSARLKNASGWGGISRRKVLIDTALPKPFEILVDQGGDPTNPTPILHFKTFDSLSGIEYYEVKIGEGDAIPIIAAYLKENPYKMPLQAPGKHTVIIKAVDKADNSTAASADVAIEPLKAPVIADFPQTIKTGDILTIKGTSEYPDAKVAVFVKKEGEEAMANDVKTDKEGNWLYIHPKSLEKATYQVWAQATDKRGAKSSPTEKITIAATLPTLLKFGKIAIDYLNIMITLAILIIALIGIIFYAWFRISQWRRRIRKEVSEAEKRLQNAFDALRENVENQVESFDGMPGLSIREKKIRDELQKALDISEQFISKEVEDIKKEVE